MTALFTIRYAFNLCPSQKNVSKYIVHVYNTILFNYKRKEVLFAVAQVKLEKIILSEQKQVWKNKCYMISHV